MSFNSHWGRLCAKRPALASKSAKLEFTSDNLEHLCYQFYELGAKSERDNAPNLQDNSFANALNQLGDIFGGKK